MIELDYLYPKQFSTMALKYVAIVVIAVSCEHELSYPLLLTLCDPVDIFLPGLSIRNWFFEFL